MNVLSFLSILEVSLETDDDEDAIIEKRRQMRKNIEQKYQYVSHTH